jgi:hypothetical protein
MCRQISSGAHAFGGCKTGKNELFARGNRMDSGQIRVPVLTESHPRNLELCEIFTELFNEGACVIISY